MQDGRNQNQQIGQQNTQGSQRGSYPEQGGRSVEDEDVQGGNDDDIDRELEDEGSEEVTQRNPRMGDQERDRDDPAESARAGEQQAESAGRWSRG